MPFRSRKNKPFMLPLSTHFCDLAVLKVASVGPHCYISVERMSYSVSFENIRQRVDVRVTRSTVEVFFGVNHICMQRLIRQTSFSAPDACLKNVEYLPDRGLKQDELLRLGTCNYNQ